LNADTLSRYEQLLAAIFWLMDEEESPDSLPSKHTDIVAFERAVAARRRALSAAGIAEQSTPDLLLERLSGNSAASDGAHYPFHSLMGCLQHVLLGHSKTKSCPADARALRSQLILHYLWDCGWQGNWQVCCGVGLTLSTRVSTKHLFCQNFEANAMCIYKINQLSLASCMQGPL
jgi:hypothetical protein